jgi:ketosteroid isomerase-like protein
MVERSIAGRALSCERLRCPETVDTCNMASANLELVRSIHAAWERGDFSSAEWAHPDIEFVYADSPSPGRWRGVAGMAEGFRGWISAWEGFRVEADEFRELDGDRVLVLVHRTVRGKASGVEVVERPKQGAHVFEIHDGKVTQLVIYAERDRAFADLSHTSETSSPTS